MEKRKHILFRRDFVPRLHIVSLNTAIDEVVQIKRVTANGVVEALSVRAYAAGKGINSACALAALKVPCDLYCISGASTAHVFRAIGNAYVRPHVMCVPGETRLNTTVSDSKNNLILHIRKSGYYVSRQARINFFKRIVNRVRENDVAIVSGSLPAGIEVQEFSRFIQTLVKMSTKVILDVRPSVLARSNLNGVYLIKPNQQELTEFWKKKELNLKEMRLAARRLTDLNVKYVVVSVSHKGAYLFEKENPKTVRVFIPKVIGISSDKIGSGDAMVAGVASAVARNKRPEDILRVGVACGYANLFENGPGRIDIQAYNRGYKSAVVEYR